MVAHLAVEGRGQPSDPAPFGGTPAPRGIEVADVDRPIDDQVPRAQTGIFALPGRHRDAGDGADVLHPTAVVRPATGLLEPTQPDSRDPFAELDRLAGRVSLVGVAHSEQIRAGEIAHDANPALVLLG